MTDERPTTRYARQKETERQKVRHETIVQKLSRPVVETFAEELETFRPPCRVAGLPSPWTDWDSDPEKREDYERDAPSRGEARRLCATCPLTRLEDGGNGLCKKYALAKGVTHGVWGGERRENNRWM